MGQSHDRAETWSPKGRDRFSLPIAANRIRESIQEHGFEARQRDVFTNLVDDGAGAKKRSRQRNFSASELVQMSV